MYDRSDLHRSSSYSYPQYPVQTSPKHYPTAHSTSSAFSASANPNEDWTKISDLAERRRIQNRIAQRNYRKKLKKRLEDLERRAGSSSASPEQRHEELSQPEGSTSAEASPEPTVRQPVNSKVRRDRTPEVLHQQYVLPTEDRSMFSQQYTRQISTSPPPFVYSTLSTADTANYATYQHPASYCSLPSTGIDMSLYPQYMQSIPQSYQHVVPSMTTPPIKQEYYHDDEINPFSMSYASLAGVDVSGAQSYPDSMAAYVSRQPPQYNRSQSYPQWPTNNG